MVCTYSSFVGLGVIVDRNREYQGEQCKWISKLATGYGGEGSYECLERRVEGVLVCSGII